MRAVPPDSVAFELTLSERLLDTAGVSMAIILDEILGLGFLPDGFDDREGYRVFRYKKPDQSNNGSY